jgi:hypothetical protein
MTCEDRVALLQTLLQDDLSRCLFHLNYSMQHTGPEVQHRCHNRLLHVILYKHRLIDASASIVLQPQYFSHNRYFSHSIDASTA